MSFYWCLSAVIVAQVDGLWQTDFSILLMVRYTGHADLSPVKFERWFLLEARMTGTMVAPSSNNFCRSQSVLSSNWEGKFGNSTAHLQIPPLVAHPHLIKYSILATGIFIHLFRAKHILFRKAGLLMSSWMHLTGFLFPQVQSLLLLVIILVQLIPFYLKGLAKPVCYLWELINLFVEGTSVFERWLCLITCLWIHM
jgi:hypothetical protein